MLPLKFSVVYLFIICYTLKRKVCFPEGVIAMKKDKDIIHKTSIGGQAVIEGVMMRGPQKIATAVRKPDGEIEVEEKAIGKVRKNKLLKLPIIRGCVNFFDSMILGIQSLMYSAKFFEVDEEGNQIEEEPGRFEKWLNEKLGSEKATNAVIYFSVCLSLVFSVGLFIVLPGVITDFFRGYIQNEFATTAIEGVVRFTIFMAYILLVSQMKDIKRVFMYHGAEHKTINCYEHGEELTVENVKKHTRLHPRCGTSFLLIVMIISILVFWFIKVDHIALRLLLRLALMPVVAGVSYEIIKFAGRHDNKFTAAISAPGKWFQHITTKEPDDKQIEVAIAAFVAVKPEEKGEDKW